METVTRYEIENPDTLGWPSGEYVKASDYDLLQQHADALEAKLAIAENELCTAKDQIPPDMDGDTLSVALIKLKDVRYASEQATRAAEARVKKLEEKHAS